MLGLFSTYKDWISFLRVATEVEKKGCSKTKSCTASKAWNTDI